VTEGLEMDKTFESIKPIRSYATPVQNELTSLIRGDVETIGEYNGPGLLFKALFGGVNTTGAGPYTHAFPAPGGIADKLNLTIEAKRDSDARNWRYAGTKVVGVNFTASISQSPRLIWSFVAKSEAIAAAATASYPVFAPMTIGDTSIAFDGGSALPVSDISVTVSFPVDEPFKIGSANFAFEPIDENIEVTGTATMYLTDAEMTQYNKFDGSTDVSIVVASDNATESLTWNMHKSRLTSASAGIDGRERHVVNLGWMATAPTVATGTHTEATPSATVCTDSAAAYTPDALIGLTINNTTDASAGLITDNDATTITVAALIGGSDQTFSQNDAYTVTAEAAQVTLVNQDAALP
jgi:hypothetical protein